jgi:monovalent cation:H+ antiporter-2, CPA2 family
LGATPLGPELLVLGILFVVAYALGRLGKLVGLPSIPIYMLVGLLASPHTHLIPGGYQPANVELVAVLGLIFLLFNLGLDFDQDEFFGNARGLLLSGGTRLIINFGIGIAFGFWVGWGAREALIIAGMTATSSSAIVTKLLIELRRLANPETPVILGIAVVEDVFVAFYLAIVAVVVGNQHNVWLIVLQLGVSFAFLVVMFALARWGGKHVARLLGARDDELFTILFFGLAVAFGGIGELLGVSDAIGAFLIGLVIGATRFRSRIEGFALPLRDVFGAFFFVNFGLALNPSTFGSVLVPVAVGVVMTLLVNAGGGWLIALLNGLPPRYGLGIGLILQNRGEFALILATLATGAGLDPRLTPFAGLYVLVMSIIGPVLTVNSERFTGLIYRRSDRRAARELAAVAATVGGGVGTAGGAASAPANSAAAEAIALMEGATGASDEPDDDDVETDDDAQLLGPEVKVSAASDPADLAGDEDDDLTDPRDLLLDATIQQAMEQSDQKSHRKRDPEY